jgi:hypothetical protein
VLEGLEAVFVVRHVPAVFAREVPDVPPQRHLVQIAHVPELKLHATATTSAASAAPTASERARVDAGAPEVRVVGHHAGLAPAYGEAVDPAHRRADLVDQARLVHGAQKAAPLVARPRAARLRRRQQAVHIHAGIAPQQSGGVARDQSGLDGEDVHVGIAAAGAAAFARELGQPATQLIRLGVDVEVELGQGVEHHGGGGSVACVKGGVPRGDGVLAAAQDGGDVAEREEEHAGGDRHAEISTPANLPAKRSQTQ